MRSILRPYPVDRSIPMDPWVSEKSSICQSRPFPVWTIAVIPDLVECLRKEQMNFFELFSIQLKTRTRRCVPRPSTAVAIGAGNGHGRASRHLM